MKIVTFTSNDLAISYGPSIHFLELWNSAAKQYPNHEIVGHYPSWTNADPVISPHFPLRKRKVFGPYVRQVLWDLFASGTIVKEAIASRDTVFYVRISSFHILSCIILSVVKNHLAVELNGSAIHDAKSRKTSGIISAIARAGEKALLQRANSTFSVTPELREMARQHNPSARHIVVSNGVSAENFPTRQTVDCRTDRRLRCIYVGTFTAWDGSRNIPALARQYPDVEFLMVGDGGARKDVEHNAPDNMRFIGWVDYKRLSDIYGKSDCAIVLYEPERHTALGLSSLKIREYLANGLPIFSTRMPGNEIVETYDVGLLSNGSIIDDFGTFMSSLGHYRYGYRLHSESIKRDISWDSVAKNTIDEIEIIIKGTKVV